MLPAFIMQKRSVFYAKLGICHWRGCWKRIKRGGFCKQKQQQLQTFQLFQLIKQESFSKFRQFVQKAVFRFIFRKFRLLVLVQAEL